MNDIQTREGSSPRGRGKRALHAGPLREDRLIPARAGKTEPVEEGLELGQAHPRAGGENASIDAKAAELGGSSPRGRGKRRRRSRGSSRPGLIPARAGKTFIWSELDLKTAAHPRAGGENLNRGVGDISLSGSSPRGRGKRRRDGDRTPRPRLIPARAGKTAQAQGTLADYEAHPRAGGENSLATFGNRRTIGSSPRGRGKRKVSRPTSQARGLIPARAGKTPD